MTNAMGATKLQITMLPSFLRGQRPRGFDLVLDCGRWSASLCVVHSVSASGLIGRVPGRRGTTSSCCDRFGRAVMAG